MHLFILFSRKYSGETFVQVFLKEPVPGRVKTRLAADIGDEAAAKAYRTMVSCVLRNLPRRLALSIAYTPVKRRRAIQDWLAPDLGDRSVEWVPQTRGDLGMRMEVATDQLFRDGAGRVIVIGTDCLELGSAVFDRAEEMLDSEHDVVFGPTPDGGYYLVALNAPQPAIFRDIPWSSEETLARSREAAERAGLRAGLLDEREDIDDLAALRRAEKRVGLSKSPR